MTDTPIRLATGADEAELMTICRELHEENGLFEMVEDRVRAMLRKAFNKEGGLVGVIGPPGAVEALMFLLISNAWYSDRWHLEELFSYVRPAHRKTTHARRLVEWGKHMADEVHLPAIIGIISSKRTEAKVRLYQRFLGNPTGAFFLYVPPGLDIKTEGGNAKLQWGRSRDRKREATAVN
jgi:hypothetical protein